MSRQVLAAPFGGRNSGKAFENAGKMRLVGKASDVRNFDQCHVARRQHGLDLADSRVHLPPVRRHSGRCLEGMTEMRLRQVDHSGEVGQAYRLKAMRFEEGDGPRQLTA